jgi:hypothetical protein
MTAPAHRAGPLSSLSTPGSDPPEVGQADAAAERRRMRRTWAVVIAVMLLATTATVVVVLLQWMTTPSGTVAH